YRAVSGHPVHEGAVSVVELLMMICTDPVRPVQDVAPWLEPDIAAILDRALRISPAERFPSALAMLEAITPLLPRGWSLREDMLVPLDPVSRAAIAPRLGDGTMSVTSRSGATTPTQVPLPRARRRAVAIATALGLLGLVALVVVEMRKLLQA